MQSLKPKEQHERILAMADREKIAQYLTNNQEEEITIVAVILARQCSLFVHFLRLWQLRVSDLEQRLIDERYVRHIYMNRNALYKKLVRVNK